MGLSHARLSSVYSPQTTPATLAADGGWPHPKTHSRWQTHEWRRNKVRLNLRYKDVCMSDMQALDPDTQDWGALQLTTRWRSNLAPHLESGADNLLSAATVKRASTKKFPQLENTGHSTQVTIHRSQYTGHSGKTISMLK